MEHELFHRLRRVKLDSLLLLSANILRGMFDRDEPFMNIPVVRIDGLLQQRGSVTVTAWNISDLAYFAIREASDFNTWEPSVHDHVGLSNLFLEWDNLRSKDEYEGLENYDRVLKLAVGFSQKQFWYQETSRIRAEFNRQVELLEVIPKDLSTTLNIDSICEEVTGFDLRTFRTLLFALFAITGKQSDVTQLLLDQSIVNIHPRLTALNLNKVISLYTADYGEYRQSELLENHFYVKPVVCTTSNRLIALNAYMFAKKVADGPFWAIRDYFRAKDSQHFANAFGEFFDHYVEKLFSRSLPAGTYGRVPPPLRGKTADWFVNTSHYRLIIELKSSVTPLMIRRSYPDLDSIRTYLRKFHEGVVQLDSTVQSYPQTGKTDIKLLVHYETFYLSDGTLRPFVLQAARSSLQNTEHIYFCDIGEFEWFISLLGKSESLAENILLAKAQAEDTPGRGREFSQIIQRCTDIGNEYVYRTIDHWDAYFPNLKAP